MTLTWQIFWKPVNPDHRCMEKKFWKSLGILQFCQPTQQPTLTWTSAMLHTSIFISTKQHPCLDQWQRAVRLVDQHQSCIEVPKIKRILRLRLKWLKYYFSVLRPRLTMRIEGLQRGTDFWQSSSLKVPKKNRSNAEKKIEKFCCEAINHFRKFNPFPARPFLTLWAIVPSGGSPPPLFLGNINLASISVQSATDVPKQSKDEQQSK